MKIVKNFLKMMLIFIIILSIGSNVFAETETQEKTPSIFEISSAFNVSGIVKTYEQASSTCVAEGIDDKLTINITTPEETINLEYVLENNILSGSFSGNDTFVATIISTYLADSIGIFHGYEHGDLLATLSSEEILNYTVENEGYHIAIDEEGKLDVQIDISKKIPLLDFSDTYLTVSDLEFFKDSLSGDGSVQQSKGNVFYYKMGTDGEYTILITENDTLTKNAYRSLLSIFEVMFDTQEAANYFAENYTGFSEGNKEFTGFKIEINPTKTEWEEMILEELDYDFARITISKKDVESIIAEEDEQPAEEPTENPGDQTQEPKDEPKDEAKDTDKEPIDNSIVQGVTTLPQTGKILNYIIYASVIMVMIGGIVSSIISKKYF